MFRLAMLVLFTVGTSAVVARQMSSKTQAHERRLNLHSQQLAVLNTGRFQNVPGFGSVSMLTTGPGEFFLWQD